jgi:peroxiredoxin
MFYRGNWCPLCMAQVAEIAGRYRELDEMGVSVTLISPQPLVETQKLAAAHATGFRFWVDTGNRVARELDIAVYGGVPFGVPGDYDPHTVMPTVVVTNDNGRILYSDQTDNYRVRPEPDTFIAILRRAGAIA